MIDEKIFKDYITDKEKETDPSRLVLSFR